MKDILLLGDDSTTLNLLCSLFKTEGYEVEMATSLDQCWESLDGDDFRLLFVDLDQANEVLTDFGLEIHRHYPEIRMMFSLDKARTGSGSVVSQVPNSVGVAKPFKIRELLELTQNEIERTELDDSESLESMVDFGLVSQDADLVAESGAMRKVLGLVERLAATNLPVLIIGERGTDKAVVARAIHKRGRRVEKEFVTVECGETGEDGRSPFFDAPSSGGQAPIKRAAGGTVFINNLEQVSSVDQRRIAHLHQNAIRGSAAGDAAGIRFLAGSEKTIEQLHELPGMDDEFLALFGGICIELPPLRERSEDVPLMIAQVLESIKNNENLPALPKITHEAMTRLCECRWPGNFAQLVAVIHETVRQNTTAEEITADMLPDQIRERE